jgi:hypothetical protein
MKEVVVQLASREGSRHLAAFETARNFGLKLRAMHPQSEDPTLLRWFHAEVDNAKAAEFVRTLRNIPDVKAAYVKSSAEVP